MSTCEGIDVRIEILGTFENIHAWITGLRAFLPAQAHHVL
jgi:hypothetical protein